MTECNPPLSKFFSRLFVAPIAELPRKLKGRAEREVGGQKAGQRRPPTRWHRPGAAAGITGQAYRVPFLAYRGKTHFAPGLRREQKRPGSIHCCGAHTPGLSTARVRRSIVLRKAASSVRREGHQRRVGIAPLGAGPLRRNLSRRPHALFAGAAPFNPGLSAPPGTQPPKQAFFKPRTWETRDGSETQRPNSTASGRPPWG